MIFVACGLNYKTAPLAIREKVALCPESEMLNNLLAKPEIEEGMILSTCNRTEIYCITEDINSILPWLANANQLQPEEIHPYTYLYQGEKAIEHVLKVAAGLDSMMLGEPQILGQMKSAYLAACKKDAVGENLQKIFSFIFKATKRIRSESGIGKNPISVAFAGVTLIGKLFNNYQNLNVLLIGSGETASLVAKHLHEKGVENFVISGRNTENTQNLANIFKGKAINITEIDNYLPNFDVIISATSCPLPFITANMVNKAILIRKNPMFLLDLAVPRDIEMEVSQIKNVHLYNVDDLQIIAQNGLKLRKIEANKAQEIIMDELEKYIRQKHSLKAKEMICDFRIQMQEIARFELDKAFKKLAKGECHYKVLNEFSEKLVNKLIHTPTVGLRQAASDNRTELLDLAQYLLKNSSNTLQ